MIADKKYPKKGNASRTVFVGGIPINSTRQEIREYLECFDFVEHLELPKDKLTHKLKGYAKATLKTDSGVDLLISHPVHYIKGLQVSIKRWTKKSDYLRQKDATSKRKLFVRYHPSYTESELLAHFESFGEVEYFEAKVDPETNHQRNIAYATYNTEEEALYAATYGSVSSHDSYIYCEMTIPSYKMAPENKTSLCGSPTLKGQHGTLTKHGTFPSFEPLDVPKIKSFASDHRQAFGDKKKEIKSAKTKKKEYFLTEPDTKNYFGSHQYLLESEKHTPKKKNLGKGGNAAGPFLAEEFFQFHDTKPTSKFYTNPHLSHRDNTGNVVFRKLRRQSPH